MLAITSQPQTDLGKICESYGYPRRSGPVSGLYLLCSPNAAPLDHCRIVLIGIKAAALPAAARPAARSARPGVRRGRRSRPAAGTRAARRTKHPPYQAAPADQARAAATPMQHDDRHALAGHHTGPGAIEGPGLRTSAPAHRACRAEA